MQFDASLLDVSFNATAIRSKAKTLQAIALGAEAADEVAKIRDLVFAINCIDLTTLGGDDSASNVSRLVWRALNPLSDAIVQKLAQLDIQPVTTGAVCGFSTTVADMKHYLEVFNPPVVPPIACAVAGFPAGKGKLSCTIEEVKYAIDSGANEVDIVINRTLVVNGRWRDLYEEVKAVAEVVQERGAHLKVILSTGELGSLENVYKAAMVSMWAGANFIKTSTGKETTNAKIVCGLVMTRAIRDFYLRTGVRIGLKPAGGLKDATDALYWVTLVRTQLGTAWLNNGLFRIGASSLLTNIEAELFKLTHGKKPASTELSF